MIPVFLPNMRPNTTAAIATARSPHRRQIIQPVLRTGKIAMDETLDILINAYGYRILPCRSWLFFFNGNPVEISRGLDSIHLSKDLLTTLLGESGRGQEGA